MNSVYLVGRLTKDVTAEPTSTGTARARFSMAVDRHNAAKEADFPTVTIFGKTAENVARYCPKGSLIAVIGHITTGSYEKDGRKIYTTDIIGDRVEFLNTRPQSEQPDFEAVEGNVPF